MNRILFTILFVLSFAMNSCNLDTATDPNLMACLQYETMDSAISEFDGTSIAGRQVQLKANGVLVYDSCQYVVNPVPNDYYDVMSSGAQAAIRHYFAKNLLPASENFEMLVHDTCDATPVSLGTAIPNYNYTYHPEGSECSHDFYSSEQWIVFQ